MQQQPPPMMPMIPSSFPSTNITTEQIQKYLDENKQLILAILDNQNLGKLAECAQYQAQLQKNLMYLAAIADAQPQAPSMPSQMHPHAAMQQGGQYMQHPQATAQPPVFAPKVPVQFNPQQMQEQQQHQLHHAHQQSIPGHMIMMRPGTNNGMHAMHAEATHGAADFARGGVGGAPSGSVDGRGGSKQDSGAASEAGSGDGHGSSAAGHGSGADAEPSYLKGSEEDAS